MNNTAEKILIIDDEAGMRQVITKILGPNNYLVFSAEDGAQGIELAKKESPHLVLMDIRLSDIDSADLIKELKKIRPGVQIIVLSGFGDVEAAVELVKEGATDYISKPFKVDALTDIVKKVLKQKPSDDPKIEEIISFPSTPPQTTQSPSSKEISKQKSEEKSAEGSKPIKIPQRSRFQKTDQLFQKKKIKFSIQKIGIIIGIIMVLGITGFFMAKLFNTKPATVEYSINYTNPAALFYENNNVWVADWVMERIYRHNIERNFKVVGEYELEGVQISGIAFDGENIWISNSFEQKIIRYKIDQELVHIKAYRSPGKSPSGLYFENGYLWSLDFQDNKIYKHNLDSTLTVLDTFDSPASNPRGIFVNKGYLYITETTTNRIFKISSQNMALKGIYSLPEFGEKENNLAGITFDGENIWCCSDGINKIYKNSTKALKAVKFK